MTPRAARAKARADALAASIYNGTKTGRGVAKKKNKAKKTVAGGNAEATADVDSNATEGESKVASPMSKSQKRKEKRIRKKKRDAEEARKRNRKIHFGTVSVREFQRQVGGGGGIPKVGGWSLGLGKVVCDIEVGTIEDLDKRKLEVKRQKLEKFRKTCSKSQLNTPSRKILKPCALKQKERERLFMRDLVQSNVFNRVSSFDSTGSFDKAAGCDAVSSAQNALKHAVKSNEESKQPLLSSSPVEFLLPGELGEGPVHMQKKPTKKNASSKNKRRRSRGRSRGDSGGSFSSTTSSRSRNSTGSFESKHSSGSIEGDANERQRTESQELLASMQAINLVIAEEDKKILQSREDKRQGCNCTRNSMFSIISKMPEKQIKSILEGHGKKPVGGSRKKMAKQYVSEVVNVCGLCLDNGCPCALAGIECHDATCSCIAEEDAPPPRKSGRTPAREKPVARAKAKCQNPNGRYKYDDVGITAFRRGLLRRLGQKVDLTPKNGSRQRSPTAS
eukprot:g4372.t1